MKNKHVVNYKLIFTVMTIMFLGAVFLVIIIWSKDFLAGILATILLIVLEVLSIKQLFIPQRIRSVTITSSAIVIEYRETSVNIPYKDCKRIEHYNHGPLTERIFVYAKDYYYEIPFDLKHFHNMCRSIYAELLNINMEHITDEWFHKRFGK